MWSELGWSVDIDFARKLERELAEARAESIRWMSIAEGRGRTDDEIENDTQCELAAWELLKEADNKLAAVTEQRDRLAEVINAATILIAAKGRHNTMLAYEGLRATLQSITPNAEL
jgi:predicted transcriptional regulator